MLITYCCLLFVCLPERRGWRTTRLYFLGSLQLDSSSDLGSMGCTHTASGVAVFADSLGKQNGAHFVPSLKSSQSPQGPWATFVPISRRVWRASACWVQIGAVGLDVEKIVAAGLQGFLFVTSSCVWWQIIAVKRGFCRVTSWVPKRQQLPVEQNESRSEAWPCVCRTASRRDRSSARSSFFFFKYDFNLYFFLRKYCKSFIWKMKLNLRDQWNQQLEWGFF